MVYHRIFKLKESEVWKVRLANLEDWVGALVAGLEAAAEAAACDGKGARAAGSSVAYCHTVLAAWHAALLCQGTVHICRCALM